MATISCKRCGSEAEGLGVAPLPGEIGEQVRAGSCGACWKAWMDQQVILMNEAQLSPADPEHYTKLVAAMREFLSL